MFIKQYADACEISGKNVLHFPIALVPERTPEIVQDIPQHCKFLHYKKRQGYATDLSSNFAGKSENIACCVPKVILRNAVPYLAAFPFFLNYFIHGCIFGVPHTVDDGDDETNVQP